MPWGFPVDVWEAGSVIAELKLGHPLFHEFMDNEDERMWLIEATLGRFDTGFINNLKAFNPLKDLFDSSGRIRLRMDSKRTRVPYRKPKTKRDLDEQSVMNNPERFLNVSKLEVCRSNALLGTQLSSCRQCRLGSADPQFLKLVRQLLVHNPSRRTTAATALLHPYFAVNRGRLPN